MCVCVLQDADCHTCSVLLCHCGYVGFVILLLSFTLFRRRLITLHGCVFAVCQAISGTDEMIDILLQEAELQITGG